MAEQNQKEMIKKIEHEENLNRGITEVRDLIIERIIQPIYNLSNTSPFIVLYVAKASGHDKILQISKFDTDFKEGDNIIVVKLDNFDLIKAKLSPFFKTKVCKYNKIYIPKSFHDQYPIRTKVLVVKPILIY